MKRGGESNGWALAFEFVPAVIFGSAVAFASGIALKLPRLATIPLCFGVGAFALSLLALRWLGGGAKPLPMAQFDQSELERELEKLAEEMQRHGAFSHGSGMDDELGELVLEDDFSSDELLLEDPLELHQEDSRVIRLFDPRTQTAGEMQERIEQHLRTAPRPPLSDATQELHEALAALRQSLR